MKPGISHVILFFVFSLFLSACEKTVPTPALPLQQITPTNKTPTYPTPDLIPDLNCTQDSDCAFAYRIDSCCPCGEIFNKEQVENDPRLRYVDEPEGYAYKKWRAIKNPLGCMGVMCAPCQMPPFGLVCDAGTCREAQTWQEILPTCSSQKEANMVDWCITYAAQSAFNTGETGQAVEICNNLQGGEGDMPKSQQCLMQVVRNIIEKDPRNALDFCRANMDRALAMCLNESGFALAKIDLDSGLAVCAEIVPNYTDGQFQKDACYHNIAMIVAPQDLERAKQICEMMSTDIEYCKETAAKQ